MLPNFFGSNQSLAVSGSSKILPIVQINFFLTEIVVKIFITCSLSEEKKAEQQKMYEYRLFLIKLVVLESK